MYNKEFMRLVIKFPTRNRPVKFLETLKVYADYLDDKSTKIIVSCDADDESMQSEDINESIIKYACQSLDRPNIHIHYGNNKSKIEAINADLDGIDFDVLLLASDDMIPVVSGYDTIIKNDMWRYYPDMDGVLWYNDGFQKSNCNTLCILGKKYYDRFGYIYNPEYKSLWCDVEFTEVSKQLDKCTYFDNVIIQHQHPAWGFGGNDSLYVSNETYDVYDYDVYQKRKSINFGL